MKIRNMSTLDLEFAAKCTAGEGWLSETQIEFEGFLEHSPEGCFIVEEEQEPVAIGIATSYGSYGFIGELIVSQKFRGHFIGGQLLDHAVNYLRNNGAQNILLDGVLPAISLYERAGFRKVCRSLRFMGKLEGALHTSVRAMRNEDLPEVKTLDLQGFGVDRSFFLERRFRLFPELSHVLEMEGEIAGFILGRLGNGLVSAGPWVVRTDIDQPEILLRCMALESRNLPIAIGTLETNLQAVGILRSLGLSMNLSSPWRMVLGHQTKLGTSPMAYSIGSAAKG
jgi:ribosomal protein S18 acetylase RimI-like enzyme